MKKLKSKHGMTMAEVLVVVAIIVILSAVAFVGITQHQRSLGQLERDQIAQEIFVVAQNHLSMAQGQGYLGLTGDDFGTPADGESGIYYLTVNNGSTEGKGQGIMEQLFPFGSIDETIRTGGSYLVCYQKDAGVVTHVFYCSSNGTPEAYNHILKNKEYATVRGLTGDEHKAERRTFTVNGEKSILGWYGGAVVSELETMRLENPEIVSVNNEDTLFVRIEDTNQGKENALLKLIVTGAISKAQKAYDLTITTLDNRISYNVSDKTYTVTLDDITQPGMQFGAIRADSGEFLPGEDITVQAVSYSTKALSNVAYSAEFTTNSLFDSVDVTENTKKINTAKINNIRHLENLDQAVSKLNGNSNDSPITAVQTSDLKWNEFSDGTTKVYGLDGSTTNEDFYRPISPSYSLTYQGQNYKIHTIKVDCDGPAGLFGQPTEKLTVSDLELLDFSIKGTDSAGALVGTLNQGEITNVVAHNSASRENDPTGKVNDASFSAQRPNVTAEKNAVGGLIGVMTGGSVTKSAAAVYVAAENGAAGGLIGSASGTGITGCYSGGHTQGGVYQENNMNVISNNGTAGGLIGTAENATVSACYSTCSASGKTAGGFAGTASGSITKSYATGLVKGTTQEGAFVGMCSADLDGNYFFEMVNERPSEEDGFSYLSPLGGPKDSDEGDDTIRGVTAMDSMGEQEQKEYFRTYNSFFGHKNGANPYDKGLKGGFQMPTVQQLDPKLNVLGFVKTHYGDWPTPETIIVNRPAS